MDLPSGPSPTFSVAARHNCVANFRNHCGARRISGNLPEGLRRVTVAPQHKKESNADAVRRCTQNTLMLPCGSKTVDHAFDIDVQALPASGRRWSRGPIPSACSACIAFCICVEILA
jgi:hypothetical protein